MTITAATSVELAEWQRRECDGLFLPDESVRETAELLTRARILEIY